MHYIAHRGMNRRALENTIPAFELAIESGADGVELDARLARCGTPIVFHDDSLESLFGVTGAPSDYTAEELGQLTPLEADFEDVDADRLRIPTLEEALRVFPEGYLVNVEIKAPEVEVKTPTAAVADVLQRVRGPNYLVSSFNPIELARFAAKVPGIPLALLFHGDHAFHLRNALSAPVLGFVGLKALHPHWKLVSPDMLERAHGRGWKVNVWTVNDPVRGRWLRREGVDALISDVPDVVREG